MRYSFEIPGTLPTHNEYIRDCRSNRYGANKVKQDAESKILDYIPADAPKFTNHVCVYFTWIRPNSRCDKDNVAFAKKFILDALQKAGVIKRDSWKLATPFDRGFSVNKANPRTIVEITDEELPSFSIGVN